MAEPTRGTRIALLRRLEAGTPDALACRHARRARLMTLSLITGKAALALTIVVATTGGGVGCVSAHLPPSASHIASAEAAIRNARELGAEQVPDAAVHLELARRQLARAMSDIDRGDAHDARWMVVRADADAHLALALTREARIREAADEMAARVHDLASNMHAGSGEPP